MFHPSFWKCIQILLSFGAMVNGDCSLLIFIGFSLALLQLIVQESHRLLNQDNNRNWHWQLARKITFSTWMSNVGFIPPGNLPSRPVLRIKVRLRKGIEDLLCWDLLIRSTRNTSSHCKPEDSTSHCGPRRHRSSQALAMPPVQVRRKDLLASLVGDLLDHLSAFVSTWLASIFIHFSLLHMVYPSSDKPANLFLIHKLHSITSEKCQPGQILPGIPAPAQQLKKPDIMKKTNSNLQVLTFMHLLSITSCSSIPFQARWFQTCSLTHHQTRSLHHTWTSSAEKTFDQTLHFTDLNWLNCAPWCS